MTHASSDNTRHHTAAELSNETRHFFHVLSNIRPIVWIGLYVALVPVFAVFYWLLPDGQFRIPDNAGTDFGSWLYYSIVTITTLGFGDYTPAHAWAQTITAIEVMCGLIILGLFLNAVGSMKSEIDVTSEIEKQKRLREEQQAQLLKRSTPGIVHLLNTFLAYCYAVTTPLSRRGEDAEYNPDFTAEDMKDMYRPSGLPIDHTGRPAVQGLLRSAERTALALDSLQSRVDLTQWPGLLEDCFRFVAACQLFSAADSFGHTDPDSIFPKEQDYTKPGPVNELYHFIKENGRLAREIETTLSGL
ncbi:MAG: potassium channel family protein [Muribaculaceae bacterium]|nr:potassium channel family protein [Muribaculaceae bacterium]